jgi:hypothetical protein
LGKAGNCKLQVNKNWYKQGHFCFHRNIRYGLFIQDDQLLLTVSTEDTHNSYDDGAIARAIYGSSIIYHPGKSSKASTLTRLLT